MQIPNLENLKQDLKYNSGRNYQQCSISLMDTLSDPDIVFDERGVCNYYDQFQQQYNEWVRTGTEGSSALQQLIETIKKDGRHKPYDCVTGISGGVDSTYLVHKAKEWGLRPLIVHFDNGWNSEIAVRNINNIIQNTGFDLYTIVVNWEEFKDLQLSYIKASVVDVEVPTDHAISGTLYKLAVKYNLKYILSGNNVVTEAIMPPSWIFNKNDATNLINIHKAFGTIPLKTYPIYSLSQYYRALQKGIRTVKPLNLMSYTKDSAKLAITQNMSWQDYGGKHYESVFTKFYQAYILPAKFKIDKRKAHLSNLIFSGQLTKEQALHELALPLYDSSQLEIDIEYVLKKWGLEYSYFEEYINSTRNEHEKFGAAKSLTNRYPILKVLRPFKNLLYKR